MSGAESTGALIPLVLSGVSYRLMDAVSFLRRNLLI